MGLPDGAALVCCRECRGVLANPKAVAVARKHFARAHPLMVELDGPRRCRACAARLRADATKCVNCKTSVTLACPHCLTRMRAATVVGVVVDVCKPCQLAFFDRGEFARICRAPKAFARAITPEPSEPQPNAASLATDALILAPDAVGGAIEVAAAAGGVALDAAQGAAAALAHVDVADTAAAAGAAALHAAEFVAEGSEAATAVVLEVLGGLFDGW